MTPAGSLVNLLKAVIGGEIACGRFRGFYEITGLGPRESFLELP